MRTIGASRTSKRVEVELLFHVARTRMDALARQQLIELVRQDLDWPYTSRQARWHGTLPLLYWHLESTCPHEVPAEVRQDLRSQVHIWARSCLSRTRELLRILSQFETLGIDAVPYKGPLLAASLYHNLALRPYGDLDLFIRRSDFRAAKELLLSLGYQPKYRLTSRQEAVVLRSRRVYDLYHKQHRVILELHWSVVPEYFSSAYEGEDLWTRLIPVSLAGRTFRTLSPEDCLLVFCLHGAKHLWHRIIWICDIAELIRAHPDMSWTRIQQRARTIGCERMVLLGIHLARELLDAPVPRDLSREIETQHGIPELAESVYRLLVNDEPGVPGGWESGLFYLKVRESLRQKAADMLRVMLIPNPEDWAHSPTWLSCRLARPVRLLKRYGFCASRLPRSNGTGREASDPQLENRSDPVE